MLPFYEQSSGKLWDDIEEPVKLIILSLMKLVGLGFFIQSILMISFPIINYFLPNSVIKYLIPAIAFIYCSGLFAINFSFYKKTKADSPWKESVFAMIIIAAGIIISAFN